MNNFPFPNLDNVSDLIKLVNQILKAKKANAEADTTALEKETNQIVYKLYGLTAEEIKIVEGS